MLNRLFINIITIVLLMIICLFCWVHFYDASGIGTAVFGVYKERWFLLNLLITYVTVWYGIFLLLPFKRRTIFGIISAHLGLIIMVIIMEAGSFIGLVDFRPLISKHGVGKVFGSEKPDKRLRYAGKPKYTFNGVAFQNMSYLYGVKTDPITFNIQTDGFGLRNPSGKHNPKILLLGDSQIYAGLVPIENTLTERIEAILKKTAMNVAEPGYGPEEELIRLETTEIDMKGCVVLQFIYEGNDLGDNKHWRQWLRRRIKSEWPYSGLMKNLLSFLHSPKPNVSERRYGTLKSRVADASKIYFLYDGKSITEQISELEYVRTAILKARDTIEYEGGTYAIVFIPAKISVLHKFCIWPEGSDFKSPDMWTSKFGAKLSHICANEGIPFQDLTQFLERSMETGVLAYFPIDTHLNSEGHEIIASYLAPWVKQLMENNRLITDPEEIGTDISVHDRQVRNLSTE